MRHISCMHITLWKWEHISKPQVKFVFTNVSELNWTHKSCACKPWRYYNLLHKVLNHFGCCLKVSNFQIIISYLHKKYSSMPNICIVICMIFRFLSFQVAIMRGHKSNYSKDTDEVTTALATIESSFAWWWCWQRRIPLDSSSDNLTFVSPEDYVWVGWTTFRGFGIGLGSEWSWNIKFTYLYVFLLRTKIEMSINVLSFYAIKNTLYFSLPVKKKS